ncbi:flagellar biosynthetic protein FliO [Virgibacillus sp. 179-BFC.A HS]|uniref:Flagellar biosynthetic protein FliO n=1 Tax=Tigheibacillus jepli TaxID=3035914 RepID=A0ABU5CI35_9BACI|nr:flagellar biosynthetic protein FliO [Virgibacillus sp. 179-BFC.A HS]MDY0405875.1 flagellar biosynthetic protein FliO [Virgibacillus sp. 179-BFC.A HS]
MKKGLFSLLAAMIVFHGCFLGTVLAKDKNVEEWLEQNNDVRQDKSEKDENVQQEKISEAASSPSLMFSFVKVIIVLGIILLLIYFAAKFLQKRNRLFHQVKAMENLGGISVGNQKSIQIIRVGEKLYMLGVGENVEMLKEITDEQTKNAILQEREDTSHKIENLPSFLSKNKKRQPKNDPDFKKLFVKELDNLRHSRNQILNRNQNEENHNE